MLPPASDVSALVAALFDTPPLIVVLGAHPDPSRAAHYVPAALAAGGATILPVNPRHAGRRLFGTTVLPTLSAAAASPLTQARGRMDIVNVFRRGSALPAHQDELLEVTPRCVWLQLGVRHDGVARSLEAAGIRVVQDRCLKIDAARLSGGPPVW